MSVRRKTSHKAHDRQHDEPGNRDDAEEHVGERVADPIRDRAARRVHDDEREALAHDHGAEGGGDRLQAQDRDEDSVEHADRAANAKADQKADESAAWAVDRIGRHQDVREGHDSGDGEVEALRNDDEAFAGGGDGERRRIVGKIGHARDRKGAPIPQGVQREEDDVENGDDARAVGQTAPDRSA